MDVPRRKLCPFESIFRLVRTLWFLCPVCMSFVYKRVFDSARSPRNVPLTHLHRPGILTSIWQTCSYTLNPSARRSLHLPVSLSLVHLSVRSPVGPSVCLQKVEALESSAKRFEDLEFRQLERESGLEEEKETLSRLLLQEKTEYQRSVARRKVRDHAYMLNICNIG